MLQLQPPGVKPRLVLNHEWILGRWGESQGTSQRAPAGAAAALLRPPAPPQLFLLPGAADPAEHPRLLPVPLSSGHPALRKCRKPRIPHFLHAMRRASGLGLPP